MNVALLALLTIGAQCDSPFFKGPFQVERSFALLFASPVDSEMRAVARALNLQLNVTCHGTYAGADLDDIESLLQTPLTKLDQAYKFSGIDVRAAGLRHKKQQKAKLFATDSAKAQQMFWVVGFAQHVQHVWRSLARLCDSFQLQIVVLRRRDRIAHALALVHEKHRQQMMATMAMNENLNASMSTLVSTSFVIQFDEFVEAMDAVVRDNALLDWFKTTIDSPSCLLELDLETLAERPDDSLAILLNHVGADPTRHQLQDSITNVSVALRSAIRSRDELLGETHNAIALFRRIRAFEQAAITTSHED
jgi:hypothetical protein